jgi:hypothetical protein
MRGDMLGTPWNLDATNIVLLLVIAVVIVIAVVMKKSTAPG